MRKSLFFQAVKRNIQKKLIKRRRDVSWLNSELKKLLHKTRRLWKKAKFSGDQAKWANYQKISNLGKDNLNKLLFCILCQIPHSFIKNPSEIVKSCTKNQSTPGSSIWDGTRH